MRCDAELGGPQQERFLVVLVFTVPLGMLRCPLRVLIVFSCKHKIRSVLGVVADNRYPCFEDIFPLHVYVFISNNLFRSFLDYRAQSRCHEVLTSVVRVVRGSDNDFQLVNMLSYLPMLVDIYKRVHVNELVVMMVVKNS